MMCCRVLSVLLLTTLCCGQVAVRGTVVVVVPSNAGVVIASDTRTIVKGKTCDGHTKIFDPKLRKNTVVFYTGNGNQVSDPANGIDICQHVEKSTPVLDITKFLTNQANLLPDTLLTIPELQRIATRCLDLVTQYSRTHRLDPAEDGGLFQGVIVTYEAGSGQVRVGRIRMTADAQGRVGYDAPTIYVYEKTDQADRMILGEDKYVQQRVNISRCDAQIRDKTVAMMSLNDAATVAQCVIASAEKQAEEPPPPPRGLGGPIDVFRITKNGVESKRIKSCAQ